MAIKLGDKVTIRRGKNKGEEVHVQLVVNHGKGLVVQDSSGETYLVTTTNVREPEEATISQDELAALIGSVNGPGAGDGLADLVHAIDAKFPGFAARVGGPAEEAE